MKIKHRIFNFLDGIYRKEYIQSNVVNLFKLLKKGPSRFIAIDSLSSEDIDILSLPEKYTIEQTLSLPFCLPETEQENNLELYQEFNEIASKVTHEVGTVSLKNVSVDFPTFLHIWKGKVLSEISTHQRATKLRNLEDLYFMLKLESILWKKQTAIKQECIFILGSFPGNYFHWLIQMLPKIGIIENNHLLKDLPIVIPKNAPNFVKETLEIIGYLDKVMFLDDGVYKFDKLHICTPLWTGHPDITFPETIEWLRRNFIKQENYAQKRRIYISRKDARERNITNESDLEPILNEYGFEIITLSNYSVAEKIQIFQEAEMIVGVIGAGLSNLVFATPGCVVIEIFSEKASKRCYSHICQMVGLKHGFLIGSKDGNGVYVKPEKLKQIIQQGFSYLDCEKRSFVG